ncbi:MAG: M20 family metallopeptidase [Acidimicrobiia bacterium]|nr:M20 family metallopeptidase [Acidimicrobiia bacterium]
MGAKQAAADRFDAVQDDLVSLSRWLYEHPELAYEEHESAARLAGFLEEQGFSVTHPAHGIDTAFRATAGTEGPEVVICAEYDALPEVGHACGHNIIAAAALGAGTALAGLVEDLGVRVTVLGTPAEEKYGGKVELIREGAFEGAAAAMMVHPTTRDVLDPAVLAIAHLDVEFHGEAAHASASPWEGRNALDAFVTAYVNVSTWRQALKPTDRVHGVVTYGGKAANVIPAYTSSEWFVRAADKARLDVLLERFTDQMEAAARASACTVEITPQGCEYTDMRHDATLARLYAANSEALGRPLERAKPGDPAGSTDMGNVSYEVPSIHPMLAIETDGAVNHQPGFAAATITESGERAIHDGALGMAWTIVDLADQDLWGELGG